MGLDPLSPEFRTQLRNDYRTNDHYLTALSTAHKLEQGVPVQDAFFQDATIEDFKVDVSRQGLHEYFSGGSPYLINQSIQAFSNYFYDPNYGNTELQEFYNTRFLPTFNGLQASHHMLSNFEVLSQGDGHIKFQEDIVPVSGYDTAVLEGMKFFSPETSSAEQMSLQHNMKVNLSDADMRLAQGEYLNFGEVYWGQPGYVQQAMNTFLPNPNLDKNEWGIVM